MNPAEQSNAHLDAIILDKEAPKGDKVFQRLCDFLRRFVTYPSEHALVAHALWIMHAHLMDKWDSTPRIAFLSKEPGSGKTRALEITELMVPNPVCAVNVSAAYLFRKTGSGDSATILFDEIDTVFGPKAKDNEDVRGLLNAGHRRGAVAGRCVVHGKNVETEEIPAYAAVALAGLGLLPDTILSRSIIIRMRRRRPDEKVEPFRRRIHEGEGTAIRHLIEAWARGVGDIVWPAMPPEVQDRDADVWEAPLAVADLIGGKWSNRARKAAVALVTAAKEIEPTLGIRLLADLKVIFKDADYMATADILPALHGVDESPWADIRGKPLDSRGLANRLAGYEIKPKVIRTGGATTARGYVRADLTDAWVRYLTPIPEKSVTSATSVTSPDLRGENPQKNGHVTDVTHVTPSAGMAGEPHLCDQCSTPGANVLAHVDGAPVWLHPECARYRETRQ